MNLIMIAISLTILSIALMWYSKRQPIFGSGKAKLEDEKELHQIFNKSIALLTKDHYYLNKDIKLKTLASELGCGDRLLSRAINRFGCGNFNKFINSFRIAYAKQLLTGGAFDHYTMEAIAEECGFSNKVSFYNAFKGETGTSPAQFKSVNNQIN